MCPDEPDAPLRRPRRRQRIKNTPTGFELFGADFFADTRFDGSTISLPVLASSLRFDAAHPRFQYAGAVS